jgi:hypothetical protein
METYTSPSRVGLHVCELSPHMTQLLSDPLVLLDRMHGTEMKVGATEEEDL